MCDTCGKFDAKERVERSLIGEMCASIGHRGRTTREHISNLQLAWATGVSKEGAIITGTSGS